MKLHVHNEPKLDFYTLINLDSCTTQDCAIFEDFFKIYDVNVTDAKEKTMLHHAAAYGSAAQIDYLLEKKADTNIKDKQGFYSIHFLQNNTEIDDVERLRLLYILKEKTEENDPSQGFANSPFDESLTLELSSFSGMK